MDEILINFTNFEAGYNTKLILISSLILGAACGVIGSFMVLRKRTLLADTLSHATLPGIGLGFLLSLSLGLNEGRFLPLLMAGAFLMAMCGGLLTGWIKDKTRLSEDTAIASVLGMFYGAGIVLLSLIQNLSAGSKAGLDSFLLGQISGITLSDAWLIAIVSAILLIITAALFKEFILLSFDQVFAQTAGTNTRKLDLILLALIIAIVCAGLKTVGLILIVALLTIPPVTAKLWTKNAKTMVSLSACLGALSCAMGVYLSAIIPNVPTGGAIVLFAFTLFAISIIATNLKRNIVNA